MKVASSVFGKATFGISGAKNPTQTFLGATAHRCRLVAACNDLHPNKNALHFLQSLVSTLTTMRKGPVRTTSFAHFSYGVRQAGLRFKDDRSRNSVWPSSSNSRLP